jgi:phosphoribosylglycinamide formyltransferase 1
VPVLADDTEESLNARVITQEHRLLPQVVRALVEGRITLLGRRVVVEGMPSLLAA